MSADILGAQLMLPYSKDFACQYVAYLKVFLEHTTGSINNLSYDRTHHEESNEHP